MKKYAILFISCCILTSVNIATGQCIYTISSTNVLCHGDSNGTATVNIVTGIPPYTYVWNTTPTQDSSTAINLVAGTYIVTVTDSSGWSSDDSVTIIQPDQLIDSILSVDTICDGDCTVLTITTTGGTVPYSYQLTPSSGLPPVVPPYTVCPNFTTTYTVTVTDLHGCIASFSKTIYVISCFGISSNGYSSNISIYPNPATDRLFIDMADRQITNMSIYNSIGELVLQGRINKKENEINISGLTPGLFIIRLTGAAWTMQKEIIIE